jgi:hypothetical protein
MVSAVYPALYEVVLAEQRLPGSMWLSWDGAGIRGFRTPHLDAIGGEVSVAPLIGKTGR